MNELTNKISEANYKYFIWHAVFLALAASLMDIDTIMPAILGDAGGRALQMGVLVTIMVGGSSFSQVIFAPYLHNKKLKKKFLLIAINARIFALVSFVILFFYINVIPNSLKIWAVLFITSIFSFSGAFANISYTDIMGKSVKKEKRKSLLSLKQVIFTSGLFVSAILARKILSVYAVPKSYAVLFIFAAIFLAVASLGFWKLKEVVGDPEHINGFKQIFDFMSEEIRGNKKLRRYLFLMNTMGVSISLMPFLILYAKENLVGSGIFLGNILFVKVSGGILAGSFLFYFSKKFRYTYTLYAIVFFSVIMLVLAYFSMKISWLFYLSFFFGGVMFATYSITISGILLEITHSKNRAMYTGLTGAGSIIPAIFPLVAGTVIKTSGFTVFFIITGIIILSSLIFIKKLNCVH